MSSIVDRRRLPSVAINLAAVSKLAMSMLLAGGLFLRLWRIEQALWYDEAFSAWLASLPIVALLKATLNDVHPPLYYLLLAGWSHLFGSSELSLRLPSLLAGLGLVIVTYQVGHSLRLSRRAVWLSTAVCAFSPFQIYYSQEARAYALESLAVALVALGLLQNKRWLAVTASLVALYLSNLAPLFIGPLWVMVLLWQYRRWRTPALIVALGYLPGLAWTIYQAIHIKNAYWIPPITSPGRILAVLDDLIFFTPNNVFVLASGFVTALALVLVVSGQLRVFKGTWVEVGGPWFLAVAVFYPLGLVTLASLIWQPVLISRVMAPIAPFFYLLIAWAVTLNKRRLFWLALAAPVVAAVLIGPLFHPAMGRRVTDTDLLDLYGLYQPGDGLYHANVGSYIVWHYYRPDIPQYLFPQHTTLEQNLTQPTLEAMGAKEAYLEEVYCTVAKRWWLIYFNNPTTAPVEYDYIDYLLETYPNKKIALLRYDVTVEAWLVLIEPKCN